VKAKFTGSDTLKLQYAQYDVIKNRKFSAVFELAVNAVVSPVCVHQREENSV
jgi:hypothetical protein